MKEGRSLYEMAQQIVAENGGKVLHSWATLGSYDFVAVVEAPDDATMMKISAQIAVTGGLTAETMAAVPTEDFVKATG